MYKRRSRMKRGGMKRSVRRGRRMHGDVTTPLYGIGPKRRYEDVAGASTSSFVPLRRRRSVFLRAVRRKQLGPRNGNRQYSYKRSRLGRQGVITSLIVPTRLDRWQRVKLETPNEDPDDLNYSHPGSIILFKGDPAAAGNCNVPVNVYSLTTFGQNFNNPNAAFQLEFTNVGAPVFSNIGSQNANGLTSATSHWVMEDARALDTSSANRYSKVQTLWYDIRLKLYGARKQTVTYDVQLVRFTYDYLDPFAASTATSSAEYAQRCSFWQSMARGLTTNSILPGNMDWMRYVKVLRRRRIVIQGSTQDDLDRQADSVDLRWFVRDSRVRDYTDNKAQFGADTFVNDNTFVTRGDLPSEITENPPPRSRLFLIVKATDMSIVNGATDDQDDNPSYDIVMRRRVRMYP